MGLSPFGNHADVPLVSIILVCRNPGPQVETALESTWRQQGAEAETIVIDGASTDGTREWLEARRARLTVLVSEPDRGVYDAMNKGLAAARGEWIIFLGADDHWAAPDTIAQASEILAQASVGVVAGRARFADGRVYAPQPGAAIRRNFVHHQAAFYHRSLFARQGGFDLRLGIQADYDLNLRLLHAGVAFTCLPHLIAHCGTGGLSDGGAWRNYREEITVRHRHFPAWRCWPWDLISLVRFVRKRLVRLARVRPAA